MKIPRVLFVKHCPNLSPERKIFLEKHLNERVPIEDVRWIEDYNHEHLFVQWLNAKYNLPYGPKITSNFVKNLMIFKHMVDEKIESALIVDDDVTFHKDWVKYFESIPSVIEFNTFINLGTASYFNIQPKVGQIHKLGNNGGCEGIWCSLDFATQFLSNLNMDEAIDIVWHGFLMSQGKHVLCMPLCHQTSGIEKVTTLDHDTRRTKNWIEYVRNYTTCPKLNFFKLLENFKKFEERKMKVEDKFEEIYGKRVNILNVKYLLNEEEEFQLNILDF